MITFAKRNLLVFFKDKSSVFFSLFAVFIIIGLYALFLGDMMAEQVAGLENRVKSKRPGNRELAPHS